MTIIQVPVLEKTFGATTYAIDRADGQFYLVEGTKLMALNLYGFLDEQDWPDTPNIPMQAPIPSQGLQSTSTPPLLEWRTFNLELSQMQAKTLEI